MDQDALTQKLYSNYEKAGRDLGYWGSYFLRELKKHGGLKVAKRMLAKSTRAGDTKGFLALADHGRPELSIEAVVLLPEFRELFSPEELSIAEKRLKRFPSISWRKDVGQNPIYPDELPTGRRYREGAVSKVQVNRYERDSAARRACLAKHGTRCQVCGLRFDERYGEIGKDFIHVHHLKPLAAMRKEYELDPQTDLRPVCPNCHAMLHTSEPPLSISELKSKLRSR
jgi:5-methylcytosine-specific restriction protein A